MKSGIPHKNFSINLYAIILIVELPLFQMSCRQDKSLDPSVDFGAYYTHLVTNDNFEKTSRTGDYADIIVVYPPSAALSFCYCQCKNKRCINRLRNLT
jgi:hypothetical protein